MELNDFIGKVVVIPNTKHRFVLTKITDPEIYVRTEKPNERGHYTYYCWKVNGPDPFSAGELSFEDPSLNEPFSAAYAAYQHTKEANSESYLYYLMNCS